MIPSRRHKDRIPGFLHDHHDLVLPYLFVQITNIKHHVLASFAYPKDVGMLWRYQPPAFPSEDITRPGITAVDVSMQRRECAFWSYVGEAVVIAWIEGEGVMGHPVV
jgi:hypothetical protein